LAKFLRVCERFYFFFPTFFGAILHHFTRNFLEKHFLNLASFSLVEGNHEEKKKKIAQISPYDLMGLESGYIVSL